MFINFAYNSDILDSIIVLELFLINKIESYSDDEFKSNLTDIDSLLKEFDDTFDLDLNTVNKNQILKYLDTTYNTDMQDWFSAISNDLAEIHDLISTWTNKLWNKVKDKAKKFHFTFNSNWERSLWKTLFNRSDIYMNDSNWIKTKQYNTAIIWSSSVKLKWWFTEYSKSNYKPIYIDWQKYLVVWEIKWATTWSFVNAASDSFKFKDEQSISEQIINLLYYRNKTDFVKTQTDKLDSLWKETIWTITEDNIDLPTFGEANIWLANLQKKYNGVWWLSDSIVSSRVKAFIDWAKEIINWAKWLWSSYDIKMSTIDLPNWSKLKRNEIVISKKADIIISTLERLNKRKEELELKWDTKSKEYLFILDQINNWIYVTSFRNPIPNKENLWLYRVRYAEDVWYNTKKETFVKSHDFISHPESAYMKQQADHDWDHWILISIDTAEWNIIARDLLDVYSEKDLIDKLIDENWNSLSFKNKVSIIEQVESEIDKSLLKPVPIDI